MATDYEFRLGAAPGNPETHVKLAILMWIFILDNENNFKDNLYVRNCRTVTSLYPEIFKTKIKSNSPTSFKIHAEEEFIHSSVAFPEKIILHEITQKPFPFLS